MTHPTGIVLEVHKSVVIVALISQQCTLYNCHRVLYPCLERNVLCFSELSSRMTYLASSVP